GAWADRRGLIPIIVVQKMASATPYDYMQKPHLRSTEQRLRILVQHAAFENCRIAANRSARMSIVVFDPDRIDEVDFADRMRHPAAADPAGGMWLSGTGPAYIDANALRHGRLKKLRAWMAVAGYGAVVLFDPYNQRYATG